MPEATGTLRLRGAQQHQRLIEHLVEKRVKCLEYLRQFHTSEDNLWMNTVRLGKTDIREYFRVDLHTVHLQGVQGQAQAHPPKRNASGEPVVTIPHLATEGTGTSVPVTTAPLKPLPAVGPSTVDPSWPAEYLPKLFAIGIALSELLLLPAGGAAFVNAVYELFLELDVVFASGTTSRALAGRQLKNHRTAKRREEATPPESPSSLGGGDSGPSTSLSLVTSKPYLIEEKLGASGGNLPSYDLLIPSLCTTCILVYRRMCDFECAAVGDPDFSSAEIARMILHIDRRLKKLFFGNVSKELGKLARLRTVQHTRVLTDHVFGAYTQLDEFLLEELMHTAGTFVAQKERHTDPVPSTAPAAAPTRSPDDPKHRWRRSETVLEENVFTDNDDETY